MVGMGVLFGGVTVGTYWLQRRREREEGKVGEERVRGEVPVEKLSLDRGRKGDEV